jgi:hypothetical protein
VEYRAETEIRIQHSAGPNRWYRRALIECVVGRCLVIMVVPATVSLNHTFSAPKRKTAFDAQRSANSAGGIGWMMLNGGGGAD